MRNKFTVIALVLISLLLIWSIALLVTGCQSQATYKSPDQAAAALVDAVKHRDKAELRHIFGPDAEELKSGDSDQDRADAIIFARQLESAYKIRQDSGEHATLLIGQEQWPFAVPIVKAGSSWKFDTDAGLEELTNRRIGRNELRTIAACRTLIDAQQEYYEADPDSAGTKHYAGRLLSHEGQKDGLYWPAGPGGVEPSPIGPVLAFAAVHRDANGQRLPFNGYLFKPLYKQAAAAPGGEMDYMQDGRLTRGWAVLAYPAEYDKTGIMSFLASSTGKVYEKDLGEQTDKAVESIDAFDPSDGWKEAAD